MGGMVVRKFLVEQAIDLTHKQLGLFLIASPSLGSTYADWLSPLAILLGHAQADALRFIRNNEWLQDLDKEFINLKESGNIQLRGKELVEDKFVIFKTFLRRQVVEPFAGARYFGEAFKVPSSDHFSIAKPKDKDAIQHRLLCRFILENMPSEGSDVRHFLGPEPPFPAVTLPRPLYVPGDRPTSDSPVLTLPNVYVVDEQELDLLIERFGNNWPDVKIIWPTSSNELVDIAQKASKILNDKASNLVGSDFFITNAPSAIASAIRGRELIRQRIPSLIRRASDFQKAPRECLKAAVKTYLLIGNFKIHRQLAYLSSWQGLSNLGFEAPTEFAPFWSPLSSREEAYSLILDESADILHGRLYRIGSYNFSESHPHYVYLYAPDYVLSRPYVNDERGICKWLVPQMQLELDESELPDKYEGTWYFNVLRNSKGQEISASTGRVLE